MTKLKYTLSEFQEIERLRSKARHDEAQALRHARLEAGREAEHKKSLDVARKALQMNLSIDDIIKLTGLTREEIESIPKRNR